MQSAAAGRRPQQIRVAGSLEVLLLHELLSYTLMRPLEG